VRNTLHPSIVNGVLRVRVSDFEFQPVSRIEKHLMIKLVTVGINAGDDTVIFFLELVVTVSPLVFSSFCQKLSKNSSGCVWLPITARETV